MGFRSLLLVPIGAFTIAAVTLTPPHASRQTTAQAARPDYDAVSGA